MIGMILLVRKKAYNRRFKRVSWELFVRKMQLDAVSRLLYNKNKGIRYSDYIKEIGCNSVVIYGASDVGRLFYDVISEEGITVKFFIDRALGGERVNGIPVIAPTNVVVDDTDVIVVTPTSYFDEIKGELRNQNIKNPILSLEDVIYNIPHNLCDDC